MAVSLTKIVGSDLSELWKLSMAAADAAADLYVDVPERFDLCQVDIQIGALATATVKLYPYSAVADDSADTGRPASATFTVADMPLDTCEIWHARRVRVVVATNDKAFVAYLKLCEPRADRGQ